MSSSTHQPSLALQGRGAGGPACRYRVAVGSAHAHLFAVTLQIASGSARPRRLSLPAWIPGSYLVRDFARNIVSIRAEAGGAAVPLRKLDKQTWELVPTDDAVEVHYEVYACDLSVRAAYLDQERAYFNGTSLFLRLHDAEESACAIELARPAPASGIGDDWTVETTLRPVDVDDAGFGLYEAASYGDAIDHPVQCAVHAAADFEVGGIPHRVALSGRVAHCDLPRLVTDLKAICGHQARLLGAQPVDRYLFLVTTVGEGYGGLEHADCCSLLAARDDLPVPGEREVSEGYRRFLGLCSHEYFHLWNVKRIQPAAFAAPALDREVHTTLLWWFEGVTSYYDDLVLLRSQRISAQSYLELLARSVTRLLRTPGRRRQSLAESSFDAWTKLYKADENAPNAIVSYYLKGALVAWGLDVELRRLSDDGVSLDDLLRTLWSGHGAAGRGLGEGEIEALAAGLCGRDLGEFFARYVYGTDELPVEDWCAALGIGLRLRPAKDERDEGGALVSPPTSPAPPPRPGLGIRSRRAAEGVALVNVFDGGPAQRAGLSAGDLVVAIDGIRVTSDNLQQLVARVPAGRHAVVHVFRRDELLTFDVVPEPAPADTADLWLLPDSELTAVQRARRERWLGGG